MTVHTIFLAPSKGSRTDAQDQPTFRLHRRAEEPVDLSCDVAFEAAFDLSSSSTFALVILAIAIPIIASSTRRGMRLRVNGVGALALVIGLPLVAWGIGLVLWFL